MKFTMIYARHLYPRHYYENCNEFTTINGKPLQGFFFLIFILYLIFCFSYFDHLNDNDDDSDDSDEDHTNTAAAARDATRLEPLGKVIPYLTLFNYTNKYLKLICL